MTPIDLPAPARTIPAPVTAPVPVPARQLRDDDPWPWELVKPNDGPDEISVWRHTTCGREVTVRVPAFPMCSPCFAEVMLG